jgi:hypothetical protein
MNIEEYKEKYLILGNPWPDNHAGKVEQHVIDYFNSISKESNNHYGNASVKYGVLLFEEHWQAVGCAFPGNASIYHIKDYRHMTMMEFVEAGRGKKKKLGRVPYKLLPEAELKKDKYWDKNAQWPSLEKPILVHIYGLDDGDMDKVYSSVDEALNEMAELETGVITRFDLDDRGFRWS